MEKPALKILGENGNAFAIMGAAKKAYRNHFGGEDGGEAPWSEIQEEMTSGDYDNLLETVSRYFDVE